MDFENIISSDSFDVKKNILEGGLLLIDKPLEWTSFDVVNKIRFRIKHGLKIKKVKVGHAGTLDPLASGLLLICAGKYTKQIESLSGMNKSYEGLIKLGATTATYDAEAEEENIVDFDFPDKILLAKAVTKLTGKIDQVPPIYSAIKIKGQTAYSLARRGKEVVMKSRKVIIHEFYLEKVSHELLSFKVKCSKGTYIRSLAHDLGQLLGTGAYLKSLRRTAIGPFSVDRALTIEHIIEKIDMLAVQMEDHKN